MKRYNICTYCGAKTTYCGVCGHCNEKLLLIRQIKAMLMPYYLSKKERDRK